MLLFGEAYLADPSVASKASPEAIRVANTKNLMLLAPIYDWAHGRNNQHLYN